MAKKIEKTSEKSKPVSKKLNEKDLKKLKGGARAASGCQPCSMNVGTW